MKNKNYKTLEIALQKLADGLEVEDTFSITFKNGTIVEVEVLKITKAN